MDRPDLTPAPILRDQLRERLEALAVGASGDPIHIDVADSQVGPLVSAATSDGLCLLEFGEPARIGPQLAGLTRWFGARFVFGRNDHLDRTERELDEYFGGARRRFDVPLVIRGTPFQETVWRKLLEIGYGETTSYSALADAIGSRNGQRAVGLANGQNRMAIIVPCHRVVERSGRLCGYGGGLWRKKLLLDLERRHRS
ncbi:MAG: methylated-DNA--[protein]-cysteine S-methyltransferase, partial [Gemmatimonadota bacterium]